TSFDLAVPGSTASCKALTNAPAPLGPSETRRSNSTAVRFRGFESSLSPITIPAINSTKKPKPIQSPIMLQQSINLCEVLFCIDANGAAGAFHNLNIRSVLQCPKLFE